MRTALCLVENNELKETIKEQKRAVGTSISGFAANKTGILSQNTMFYFNLTECFLCLNLPRA